MRDIMSRLTVNETKTQVCRLPEEKFDFLGYTFGRCYSPQTGRAYLGTVPSLVRHRQTKGPETDRPHLNHRVTPRLHATTGNESVVYALQKCRTNVSIAHPSEMTKCGISGAENVLLSFALSRR